ncbi:Trm112 family protein [bacterium]|nr:MAG: Trm112 family protein [bacterium]
MDASLDPAFLALLADPTDSARTGLEMRGDRLVNPVTGTAFPIIDGIPQLLPENAIPASSLSEGIS